METAPALRKRPFGVYAIIVLLLLRIVGIVVDAVRIHWGLPPMVLTIVDNQTTIDILIGAFSLLIVTICTGLFLLKRWAWIAVMILIGFNLLTSIVLYLDGGEPFLSMLLDVLCVFYLNQRSVQAAFEGREVRPEVMA